MNFKIFNMPPQNFLRLNYENETKRNFCASPISKERGHHYMIGAKSKFLETDLNDIYDQ